jgi:hypothetical protein
MKNYQPGDLVIDKLSGKKMIVHLAHTENAMKERIQCRYICNKGIMRYDNFHINELSDYDEKYAPITKNYRELKSPVNDIFEKYEK